MIEIPQFSSSLAHIHYAKRRSSANHLAVMLLETKDAPEALTHIVSIAFSKLLELPLPEDKVLELFERLKTDIDTKMFDVLHVDMQSPTSYIVDNSIDTL
jgi:hypothetical protein